VSTEAGEVQLAPRLLVGVSGELRSEQHPLELREQERTRDHLDTVVGKCAHDKIGRTAALADQR